MPPHRLQKVLDHHIGILLCILLGGFQSPPSRRVASSGWVSISAGRHSPQRILLIQLSALGDTILAIPTVRSIRQHFPDAHIAMIASSINLEYLEHCPYIDQHIPCRLEKLMRSPRALAAFFAVLRRQKFDLAIDFEHWPRLSALIAYGSRASRRIGFCAAGQHRHYPFTEALDHVPGQHEVINFLKIAKLLRCPIQRMDLEVWLAEEDWDWAGTFLKTEGIGQDRPIIAFHPEAGRRGEPRRRWPHERFVQLADALFESYGAQIILTGAPSEVELSQRIASQTRAHCTLAAGRTRINQLAALFANVDVVISGNCGPMHLATATGTPVIALHGPTSASQWAPWGKNHTAIAVDVPCSPCLNLGFEYGCRPLSDGTSPCMYTIQVREVLKACDRYLANRDSCVVATAPPASNRP